MTTLAQMRSEVARDHNWHEDDDGDRIDEVLNERFGQAAVELYEALEPFGCLDEADNYFYVNLEAIRKIKAALSKARAQ